MSFFLLHLFFPISFCRILFFWFSFVTHTHVVLERRENVVFVSWEGYLIQDVFRR